MRKFAKLYKWELNNELYASIYFAAMLSIYCIEVLLHGERSVDIFVMLQMIIVCYFIALVQWRIFSEDTSYRGRSLILRTVVWYGISMVLLVGACLAFQWFKDLQPWAMWVFIACMELCFFLIWLGIQVFNKMDTKQLNNLLSHYQEISKKEERNEDYE
ncbi:MAG: hypothetical protein H7X94_07945 [Vallitaleaceae bacterium]|nr:hypothetical protein [Vallitaleaceae bacterium]